MLKISATDYITAASAIIALSALGISSWQGYQTRKHNQLSVRPYVAFAFHRIPGSILKLTIHNYGLGPAILNRLSVKLGDETIELHSFESLRKLYGYIFDSAAMVNHEYGLFDKTTILASNREHQLFNITSIAIIDLDVFETRLRSTEFLLEYKCIYGNKFTLSGCPSAHLKPSS